MSTTNAIEIEKTYPSPIDTVWKAITDRDQMKKWYFDFPATFKPEVGSEFDWMAGPPDGKQWLHRGKITEVVKGKKLAHTWEYPGYTGTSLVTWELTVVAASTTQVKLTHIFTIPFDPNVPELKRENFVEGWTHIMTIDLTEFLAKN